MVYTNEINESFSQLLDRVSKVVGQSATLPYTFVAGQEINWKMFIENLDYIKNLIPEMPTKLTHAQGGCINCGAPRWGLDEIAKGLSPTSRNIFIKNDKAGDVIVGLCRECFERVDQPIDLVKIKANLIMQEEEFSKQNKTSSQLVDVLKSMEFLSAYRVPR